MKNITKWIQGFVAGVRTTHPYIREVQEEWQSRVLNDTESYTSFWAWQKGYSAAHSLCETFGREH